MNSVGIRNGRLEQLRREKGLSRRALAAQLQLRGVDVGQGVVARLESGERKCSRAESIALADIFGADWQK